MSKQTKSKFESIKLDIQHAVMGICAENNGFALGVKPDDDGIIYIAVRSDGKTMKIYPPLVEKGNPIVSFKDIGDIDATELMQILEGYSTSPGYHSRVLASMEPGKNFSDWVHEGHINLGL